MEALARELRGGGAEGGTELLIRVQDLTEQVETLTAEMHHFDPRRRSTRDSWRGETLRSTHPKPGLLSIRDAVCLSGRASRQRSGKPASE